MQQFQQEDFLCSAQVHEEKSILNICAHFAAETMRVADALS